MTDFAVRRHIVREVNGIGPKYRKTCVGSDSLPYCKGFAAQGAASLGGKAGHWRETDSRLADQCDL